jgi:hypothetical protein
MRRHIRDLTANRKGKSPMQWSLALGVLFFFAVLAFVLAVLAGSYILLTGVFKGSSGLTRLIQQYPAPFQPEGAVQTWQTIRLGAVRWRNCVTMVIGPQGFYFAIRQPFTSFRPVLIPWRQITATRETYLYWFRAVTLSVGNPTVAEVTVYQNQFERMRPYLAAGSASGR